MGATLQAAPERKKNQDYASAAKVVRVTVNLPETLARALRTLAEQQGKSFTQALKEAISLKLYIDQARKEGATVLLETPGKPQRELVFPSS